VGRGVLGHVHCCLINMAKSKQVVMLPLRLTYYAANMRIQSGSLVIMVFVMTKCLYKKLQMYIKVKSLHNLIRHER
jgi:hypothetical protein